MSFAIKFVSFITILVLIFSETTFSQEGLPEERAASAPSLDLPLLIESLKQRNPDLIAAKAEWLASKKRVWIDSSLPDPMGGLDLMGEMTETRVGPQESRYVISQEIPFP